MAELPERPALAPGVELAGEMPETGFTQQQWLLQRDGKFLQVTELLYRVAEQINGERTLEEIAEAVTASTEWLVTADNVRQLIEAKLIPLGLVATSDGSNTFGSRASGEESAPSPLGVNMRKRVIGPQIIDPIAKVLQVLYAPPVLISVLVAAALAHGWLYGVHGMTSMFLDIVYRPWTLFVILAVMVLAGIFHEFGHAAALRYGGGKVRGMGVGFYLIYPAFYTDVTDSYRLGRWARVRTDLGGFYFYLIFALGIMALYLITGQAFLLFIVVLINVDILYQCLPFVRLDGYWALADLTGVPDFFSQMRPFLASIVPVPGYKGSSLPSMKPWVRRVFLGYIILTIPVLALLFFLMIKRLPLFLITMWESLGTHIKLFSIAQNNQAILAMALLVAQMLLLALLALGILYVFYSVSRMIISTLWSAGQSTSSSRLASSLGIAGYVALVAALWAPQFASVRANSSVLDGVQSFSVSQRNHVEIPVVYAQNPPVGGNHAPIWQNCGFYGTAIASENGVHAMEHGAVWITYRPDLAKNQIELLRQRANSQPYVLASPYPDLPTPIVASAWGRQLRLDSADDSRLDQFVHTFRLGEHAPERGGPCTGGIGAPR
jgi:putative peptide zinc metalloprotease protein